MREILASRALRSLTVTRACASFVRKHMREFSRSRTRGSRLAAASPSVRIVIGSGSHVRLLAGWLEAAHSLVKTDYQRSSQWITSANFSVCVCVSERLNVCTCVHRINTVPLVCADVLSCTFTRLARRPCLHAKKKYRSDQNTRAHHCVLRLDVRCNGDTCRTNAHAAHQNRVTF